MSGANAVVTGEGEELRAAFSWQPSDFTGKDSMQDTADACKKEAMRQFSQLLSRPEDLARLAELQETVAAKLHRADLEVTGGLEAATDGVRSGLAALRAARRAVIDTRDNFASIDALCKEEGSGLANRHELIRDLAVMRVNLSRTMADAEAIVALPEQAHAALEMLSDERNLFTCWEKLTALTRRAAPARIALEAARRRPHGGVSRACSRPAATHFAAINDAVESFEATLWRSVRRSLFAGRGGCRALVRALRVVEAQEILDDNLTAKAGERAATSGEGAEQDNIEHGVVRKGFKKRVLREVCEAVEERFTMTVDSLISDEDDGDGGGAGKRQISNTAVHPPPNIPVVLENLNVLMQQLTEAYDYAIPAFPPTYRVFERVMAPAWHGHITASLGKLVRVARELSNADIIAVLNWYQSYADQMAALGVEVEAAPPEPPGNPPQAMSTPPPSVPATPQISRHTGGGPPLLAKTEGKIGAAGGEEGDGGRKGGGPSVLSLESFLATGCEMKIPVIGERHDVDDGAAVATLDAREDTPGSSEEEDEDGEVMSFPDGLVKLVDTYTSRMSQTVRTWAANLHRMTASQPLKPAEDGTLWTASDVEFFRLLNEQLEVAIGGGHQLISAAAMVISSILLEFSAQQYKRLGGNASSSSSSTVASSLSVLSSPGHFRRSSSVSAATAAIMEKTAPERAAMAAAKAVEYNVLLAGVNDASRCHRLALEIESSLADALGSTGAMEKLAKKIKGGDSNEEPTKGGSVLRAALDAFTSNAEHCAAAAAATVVSDPSVISLFSQLFVIEKGGGGGGGGGAWLEGEVTETLVATIVDYLGDVEQYVTRDLAPMVSEAVLSRVVKLMMEACMRQLQIIRPGTVDRMAADEDAIRECFVDYLPHKRVDPWVQHLANIRDVAAADDAESFVLAYGLLVQSMPELGLEPAERLLAAREDIPRATQREVLEECSSLLNSHLATQTIAISTVKKWRDASSKANLRFS